MQWPLRILNAMIKNFHCKYARTASAELCISNERLWCIRTNRRNKQTTKKSPTNKWHALAATPLTPCANKALASRCSCTLNINDNIKLSRYIHLNDVCIKARLILTVCRVHRQLTYKLYIHTYTHTLTTAMSTYAHTKENADSNTRAWIWKKE